jgi:hypothetical protein
MAQTAKKEPREESVTGRPLADRLDLPEHEREISAEALRLFHKGIADAKAGRVVRMPLGAFVTGKK